jgi:DNA-binding transcriptional MerR regulator
VGENELWTLEQLSERVADALTTDYDGQRSGRVREVPNGRTIRWYTTIGLVDRPAAMGGRTALYGRRHLLQLVAVKRLQAAGRPLADVQRQLLGSTDDELERIARVPSARGRFWAASPASADSGAMENGDTVTSRAPERVQGVRLNDSVTVLLDRVPSADEVAQIEAAAAPLLDLLDRLGLTERDTR